MAASPKQRHPARSGKVTISQIAAEVGVSKATVSFVLNDTARAAAISQATRRRVFDAATRLGYRPNAAAKALATGRSRTILMVLFDLWDEHLAERLRGAEAHLVALGYSIRICTAEAGAREWAFSDLLRTGQADGVLLSGLANQASEPALAALASDAARAGVPVVALTDSFPHDLVRYVAQIDDQAGAAEAVRHLISHGHHRVAFLGVAGQHWSESRRRGYEAALEEAALPVDARLELLGERSQSWAYDTVLARASQGDFSAIFAVTDGLAMAALSALRAAGRHVPEDCALAGFDNDERIARFADPPLTTVENPFFDTGRAAARMLLKLVDGKDVIATPLPTALVVRRSCGCGKG